MNENNFSMAAEQEPGYGQILAILIRRRFWVFGVLLGVLSTAVLITLVTRPTYQSRMQLLVEPNYQRRTQIGEQRNSESEFADSNIEIDIATQIKLMRSSGLLQRALNILQPIYPDLNDIEEFQKALFLSQIQGDDGTNKKIGTKIVEVIYEDDDPVKTKVVLEALQKVYQQYNLEQQEIRLAKGLKFINAQIPVAQKKVQQAEDSLEQFRERHNLIDPELQAKALADTLNEVRQEQHTNSIQIQQLRSRFNTLQRQLGLSPTNAIVSSRLSESSRYQAVLDEIQKTDLALVQQRLRFNDDSPQIQTLIERRQKQQALLRDEVARVLGTPLRSDSTQQITTQAQLGKLDVDLAGQLIEAQTNLLALEADSQSLARVDQQLSAELQRFPALLAQYNRLLPEVDVNRETLQQLLTARQELSLQLARGGFDWQIVEEPLVGEQIAPSIVKNLLLGVVVGLTLGSFVAFIREAIDNAVRTSDELKKQTALPLLGVVPELLPQPNDTVEIIKRSLAKRQLAEPSIYQLLAWQPFRDSLDLIYKNIQLANSSFPLKSLVITSALAGEGKTAISLGLALAAARLHQKVLLIDTDLRRPSLHKYFNISNEVGLSLVLASQASSWNQNSIYRLDSHIDILTSGPMPADPVRLLSSSRMQELIAMFEQQYDLVLLDAPPVLGMVDTVQLASLCHGVLLVGRIGQVTRAEVTQAAEMLSSSNLFGVVANCSSKPYYNNGTYTELKNSSFLPAEFKSNF